MVDQHTSHDLSAAKIDEGPVRNALQALLDGDPAQVRTADLEQALTELSGLVQHLDHQRIIDAYGADAGDPARINNVSGSTGAEHSTEVKAVFNPSTGQKIATIPLSVRADLDEVVMAAGAAQEQWSETPVGQRIQVLFELKNIMERRHGSLAELVHIENGKPIANARAGIQRAIECVEFACGLPQLMNGDAGEVAAGIECRSKLSPVGVVAGVTPFNFPVMVPMWMAPLAVGAGNSFILKPSEKTPLAAMELADMFRQAGLPEGVFSVIHGDRSIVEDICQHPDISRVGFVGSSSAAHSVYRQGADNGKGVLALGGAKNHLIVLPDADIESTAGNIVASVAGDSGQRCMAAAVIIAVGSQAEGNIEPILDRVTELMGQLQFGSDLGPLIETESLARNSRYIDCAVADGGDIRLDGRRAELPDRGNFVGATLVDNVPASSAAVRDEIFAPTGMIVRCKTLAEAISIENSNPYGNAAAIYTNSADAIRAFEQGVEAGMVGVNIGVPVPREPFPFGGWNNSIFGVGEITGASALRFWTRTKKITSRPEVSGVKNRSWHG